ncbi:MAG: pepN 3, partial [Acidobacteria bacterium]|nr:pepN 3 [Acidobacteriota bacterium]
MCWLAVPPALAASQPAKDDAVPAFLRKVEQALQSGDISRYLELLSSTAVRERARIFAATVIGDGVARAAIRERDRTPLFGTLPGDGYRLLLEVFTELDGEARLSTWQLDVRRFRDAPAAAAVAPADGWAISDQELLTSLGGLQHLSLNTRRQFTARNYVVAAEDFQLTLTDGVVFIDETRGDPTALVLLGRGEMVFSPPLEMAFVRAGFVDLGAALADGTLAERPVDARDVKRADEVFRTEAVKSFVIDLGDMTADTWSLAPGPGDLLAEVRTRRFDTLTYTKSHNEAEDISVFDRRRQRNISVYPSQARRSGPDTS